MLHMSLFIFFCAYVLMWPYLTVVFAVVSNIEHLLKIPSNFNYVGWSSAIQSGQAPPKRPYHWQVKQPVTFCATSYLGVWKCPHKNRMVCKTFGHILKSIPLTLHISHNFETRISSVQWQLSSTRGFGITVSLFPKNTTHVSRNPVESNQSDDNF